MAEAGEKAHLRTAVADALQSAWDDFVADTGCFPDCFEMDARSRTLSADFDKGNFAWMVADWLLPHLEDWTPIGTDEAVQSENERLRTWLERIAQTDSLFMAHEWARQALKEAAPSGSGEPGAPQA